MIVRLCDNCSQPTGSSIQTGFGMMDSILFGSKKLPCRVRFIIEPKYPEGDGEEHVDLCETCMKAALLQGALEKVERELAEKTKATAQPSPPRPEHFNGA